MSKGGCSMFKSNKERILFVVLAVIGILLTLQVNGALAGSIHISSLNYDGSCAKVSFDRQNKGVTINLLVYTLGSSGWSKAHDLTRRVNSGNYLEFCGLNTYRGKSKCIVKIIYQGVQQDQAVQQR